MKEPWMLFPETLIKIAALGGGLDIDCSERVLMPATYVQIASAAAASGVRPQITFRNFKALMPNTIEEIARAGQGCVTFVV